MIEKPFLAESNSIKFRNFGHKQGIQVHKRNPCISAAHPEGRQMGRHWLGESVRLIGTVLIIGM